MEDYIKISSYQTAFLTQLRVRVLFARCFITRNSLLQVPPGKRCVLQPQCLPSSSMTHLNYGSLLARLGDRSHFPFHCSLILLLLPNTATTSPLSGCCFGGVEALLSAPSAGKGSRAKDGPLCSCATRGAQMASPMRLQGTTPLRLPSAPSLFSE